MISPPGNVAAPSPEWSNTVSDWIKKRVAEALKGAEPVGPPAPFYNPLDEQLEATEVVPLSLGPPCPAPCGRSTI